MRSSVPKNTGSKCLTKADQGAIEDVLAVENDVVPFDRADVLEQGCVNAFLGDSPRSGQVSRIRSVLLDVS